MNDEMLSKARNAADRYFRGAVPKWSLMLFTIEGDYLGTVYPETRAEARELASWYRTHTDGRNRVARTVIERINR